MTPVKFKGCNVVYGSEQSEYLPLPAQKHPDGRVLTAWHLSNEEIDYLIMHRHLYLTVHTFIQPLQPVNLSVVKPEML